MPIPTPLAALVDRKTIVLIRQAASTQIDPDSVGHEGRELIEHLAPQIDAFVRRYYRFELDGLDGVPRGPALMVVNHDSGTSALEILGMGARFYVDRGTEERILGLMHDTLFKVPYLSNLLGHLGAVRAAHHTADRAFADGYKVLVAPGGNMEAFRPYSERYQIKFGGRRGWVRLALRNKVPIVPIVFTGGHETFFVLTDNKKLAAALGLDKRLRLDTFPIYLGLPWGIGVGPVFHLPLPSKCRARILPALHLDEWNHASEDDEEAVTEIYDIVTDAMQHALTEMGRERKLPVLG